AEDGIRDLIVTGVQTCALPISLFKFTLMVRRRRIVLLLRWSVGVVLLRLVYQIMLSFNRQNLTILLALEFNEIHDSSQFLIFSEIGRASCRERVKISEAGRELE